jgi:hypothetical protein
LTVRTAESQPGAGESFRRVTQTIEHFVERAVAAGGNDRFKPFANGVGSQLAGDAGSGSFFQNAFGGDRVQTTAEARCLLSFGRWIENNARAHASNILKQPR